MSDAEWEVEGTDEFAEWYGSLDADDQDAVNFSVTLLEQQGPGLRRPYADTIRRSRYPNMKELRFQARGRPLRVFFAFDPRRIALLLTGGEKTGDERFYARMVPVADDLFASHLERLEVQRGDD